MLHPTQERVITSKPFLMKIAWGCISMMCTCWAFSFDPKLEQAIKTPHSDANLLFIEGVSMLRGSVPFILGSSSGLEENNFDWGHFHWLVFYTEDALWHS